MYTEHLSCLLALLRSRRGEDQGTLDPRLAGLGDDRLRDLFHNKRVLDIGCNEGKVSLDIGTAIDPFICYA